MTPRAHWWAGIRPSSTTSPRRPLTTPSSYPRGIPAPGHPAGSLRGLSVTGGVITAAGVVLAATFAGLVREPTVYLTEVGTAVALGVLLDTLLVRTVLVPASLLTIGERVWWPVRPGHEVAATTVGGDPASV